MKMKGKAK